MASARPDMRDYFRARIDFHVNGIFSRNTRLPSGVRKIIGDVTSREIVVIMDDGTTHNYSGGRYAERKRNGCYAPLMPRPA